LAYGIGQHGETAARGTSLPIGDKSKCAGTTSSETSEPPSTIAVYDLGGGTFDVTILRLHEGVFEALSTHGNTHLGGDDFDRVIMDLVQREVHAQIGIDINSPATRQSLRLLAEQVKIRLSDRDEASIELDIGEGREYRRTLRRDEFEQM